MKKIIILALQTGDRLIETPVEGLTKPEFLEWFKELCVSSYPDPSKIYYIKELRIRVMPKEISEKTILSWPEWVSLKGGIKIEIPLSKTDIDLPFYGGGNIIK
jgi:hypothetical protein